MKSAQVRYKRQVFLVGEVTPEAEDFVGKVALVGFRAAEASMVVPSGVIVSHICPLEQTWRNSFKKTPP